MSKLLITSGCSFSTIGTWPKHLMEKLTPHNYTEHINCGMGSQGNGLISRGPMYEVVKALKTYKPEDILVGIMWSDQSRFDYRCEDPSLLTWGKENKHNWVRNPRAFVDGAPENWVIGNLYWDSIEFSTYLKFYYSTIGASIISLEHILRTQYFLKIKKIPYFFTNFVDNNIFISKYGHNVEIKYLLDELDMDQYLPVSSEHGWLIRNSEDKEQYRTDHGPALWIHPKDHHHKEFVDKIMYPWLERKGYV